MINNSQYRLKDHFGITKVKSIIHTIHKNEDKKLIKTTNLQTIKTI